MSKCFNKDSQLEVIDVLSELSVPLKAASV